MSKLRINFKIEEEDLKQLIIELKKVNTPKVKHLKEILTGRVKTAFSKPRIKKTKEKFPITSPENLRYRDQKYIVDYYNSITHPKYWEIAEKFRNELRKEKATPSEIQFKAVLKSIDVKYEFQHILFVNNKGKFFILDFYLPDYNVGIEIDGGYHFTHEQYLKDSNRTKTILKFLKLRNILRFKNNDITMNQPFLDKIKRILNESGLSRVKLREF